MWVSCTPAICQGRCAFASAAALRCYLLPGDLLYCIQSAKLVVRTVLSKDGLFYFRVYSPARPLAVVFLSKVRSRFRMGDACTAIG